MKPAIVFEKQRSLIGPPRLSRRFYIELNLGNRKEYLDYVREYKAKLHFVALRMTISYQWTSYIFKIVWPKNQ